VVARLVVGGLLLAHGAVHLLYLLPVPAKDANYPFLLDKSWLIPESLRRGVGGTAAVAIAAIYLLVALGVWGVPGVANGVRGLLIAGSVASAALFVAYWHPWLSLGMLIAVALLLVAIIQPGWWLRLVE
jgi:hypothetical protein